MAQRWASLTYRSVSGCQVFYPHSRLLWRLDNNVKRYLSLASGNTEIVNVKLQKQLFTPGPLCVTSSVKEAMLTDYGSRDTMFIKVVKNIRDTVLAIGDASATEYTTIPLQGSGTYSIEAVLSTTIPKQGAKILILENGAYGRRMEAICEVLGIRYDVIRFPEISMVDISQVDDILSSTHYHTVCIVHCETSTGVINPISEISKIVKAKSQGNTMYFVDAMSSFGAVPLSMELDNIDYLVSSANKCLQGVPGFSFIIAKKDVLVKCKSQSRSLSLDIVSQYESLETLGQFRFTPATHSMLAFQQALCEFLNEGGLPGRANRYKENAKTLQNGMAEMGFEPLLASDMLSHIITSYKYPKHKNFDFAAFYEKLSDLGQVIYPGKLTDTECFRIGTIGDLYPKDFIHLLQCIQTVCKDMDIPLPLY